jgi:cytochrome c oxidase cbb3-type subunit IV
MYKNVLQSIQGIEIYPLISLVIFALFFIGLIIWLFKIDKSYIKEMEILPLDLDEKAEAKNEI